MQLFLFSDFRQNWFSPPVVAFPMEIFTFVFYFVTILCVTNIFTFGIISVA